MNHQEFVKHAITREGAAMEFLAELVAHRTVAYRDPEGIHECANDLERRFRGLGYEVIRYSDSGPPVIYAEKNVGARRTLMFYHHYDIQPEGSLQNWTSSPWELTTRGGRAYGRGTSDDKGPLVVSIEGIRMLEELLGTLPVNVKFVVEGEEEACLGNLPKFVAAHPHLMKADGCIWESGSSMPGSPAVVTCGFKGDAYYELRAGGNPHFARTDVHSGEANIVPNPAWRLVWALRSLKDEDGRILIDGFDKEVRSPSKEDREAVLPHSEELTEIYMKDYGLDRLLNGREGAQISEGLFLEPTVTISGLTSGAQGSEDATIIPATASAKVDIRLVPDLTTEKVTALLKQHMLNHGFNDIEVVFRSGLELAKSPLDAPFIRMLRELNAEIAAPTYVRTIPMSSASGPASFFTPHVPICMTYSYAESDGTNTHGANENILVESIKHGMAYTASAALRLSKT